MGSHLRQNMYVAAAFGFTLLIGILGGCSGSDEDRGDIYGSPVDMKVLNDDELNTVRVRVVEYQIDMPDTLPPGPTKFVVINEGQSKHNFEIEGPGMDRVLAEEPLKPGEQGELRVDLKPGKYTVYCPVFNNRDRGMLVNLTVTPDAR